MLNVIGIGNYLKGDDAIGPLVIEELQKSKILKNINHVNAGSDAFAVLEFLIRDEPVLIIDCAQMGRIAGEVVAFDVNDATISELNNAISLHGYGFADIYKMAMEIGEVAPCKIIGIQPGQVDFYENLSDEVRASIPKVIDLVTREAKRYA
jgi:hydrogenase maturation protease